MTIMEMSADDQQIANEIFHSYTGETREQELSRESVLRRLGEATIMSEWTEESPNIIRGEE